MAPYEVVVRGGTVIDGTGAAAHTADVAINRGIVAEVGRVSGRGRREIDADGALVTPGFVDIHSHYDGQATWDSALAPSSWHGVTTVVMGNCGVGFAPVADADHDRLVELMEGVEDIPGSALHEGLSWDWHSFPDYLDALDARSYDIDVGAQVPHGALRVNVMGERGARRDPARPEEIEEMGRLAAEGVAAGAIGFTTSRTLNHRTSRGEPTPTLDADADELVGIARAIGMTGSGVLQLVSDFVDLDSEWAMLRRMVVESGRPLSFSLLQHHQDPGQWRVLLDRVTTAHEDGLAITAQVGVRAVGLLLGLSCTLHPFMTNRVYREIDRVPLSDRVRLMGDPVFKARVLAEATERERNRLGGRLITRFDRLFELSDPPDYEPASSTSVAARAAASRRTPEDLAYDLLLEDGGESFLYLPFLNYVDDSLDPVHEMLVHPYTVPGLADGGAHVGTICDGSFPTTLLQLWGRDRDRGRIGLPFLIERHCRATAATVGFNDRGVLAPGYRADLNVIDFEALRLHRPEMHYDLPAGGKRLLQRADGYRHTFVAGVETYRDGDATGALPGCLVRGPQPTPS
jgi:N-acyl-D-aspartate/D-glutamate deacylase